MKRTMCIGVKIDRKLWSYNSTEAGIGNIPEEQR